ncbi:MAG: DUF1727 domain-containing protein [Vampirovibrio sp.]
MNTLLKNPPALKWTLKEACLVWVIKGLSVLIRLSGKGSATSFPGKWALRQSPDFLSHLGQGLPPIRIMITGTNGKTTTATLLRDFFKADARPCLLNEKGANLIYGITTSLAQAIQWNGHFKAQACVLETDEATVPLVAPLLQPSDLAVTNLFRDQLDRYGELATTAAFIQQGIPHTTGTVFLNADDPLLVAMARHATRQGKGVLYYGLNLTHSRAAEGTSPISSLIPHPHEVAHCPECGASVSYHHHSFAHLGDWFCEACGFKRPDLDLALTPLTITDAGWSLRVDSVTLGQGVVFQSPLLGLYNAYNIAQALCIASHYGVSVQAMQHALTTHQAMFGRAETRVYQGKTLKIMLIKNPAGASEVLKTICADPQAHLLMILNDAYADGEDVSWIWDADFEQLLVAHPHGTQYTVSGTRAFDLANRLQHASLEEGWTPRVIEASLSNALQAAVASTPEASTLYILPTYTALLALESLWKND